MNLSPYLPLLADWMLKSVVVLGLAWPVAWWCRRASAANRHLIWLAAFGVLLVLPFTSRLSSRAPDKTEEAGAGAVVVLRLPAGVARPVDLAQPVVAAGVASRQWPAAAWLGANWRVGLVWFWLAGTAALLGWRAMGAVRLRLLFRRSQVLSDARIQTLAARLLVGQGIRRRVELRISEACPVAMTWGTWRPVVMLPAEAAAWPDERLDLVLRHELAHVVRMDCLARLLSQAACALYWPNPLVWLGARLLRLAQEQACDDQVLMAGAEARAYASELLLGARALVGQGRGRQGAAVAMAEPSTLESRIVGIVSEGRDRSALRRRTVVLASMAALLAAGGGVAVQVRAAEEAPVPAAKPAKPTGPVRQVVIEARFMGILNPDSEAEDFLSRLGPSGVSAPVVGFLATAQAETDIRGLARLTRTDLLSAPRITCLDGNQASISVAQEIPFPISWERSVNGAPAKPKEFDARNVGVNMHVFPQVAADGSVELDVHCVQRQLKGFVEGAVDGTGHLVAGPSGSRLIAADEAAVKMLRLSANTAYTPLFEEREARTTLRIRPEQTVVLRLGERKAVTPAVSGDWAAEALAGQSSEYGLVLVFLSAKEISPFEVPPDAVRKWKARAASQPPPGTTITEVPAEPDPFRL